jgi:hypothetical protein
MLLAGSLSDPHIERGRGSTASLGAKVETISLLPLIGCCRRTPAAHWRGTGQMPLIGSSADVIGDGNRASGESPVRERYPPIGGGYYGLVVVVELVVLPPPLGSVSVFE